MAEITSQDLTHETMLQRVGRMQVGAFRQPALGGIPLLTKIGQGEAGACYRAIHPTLDREVAVKIIPYTPDERTERFGLFLANARAAESVESPRLVKVFEVGTEADVFFQVMEYVNGRSAQHQLTILRERLKPGMDEVAVLELCIAASEGLAAAHAAGFIHRDIRPSSILIPNGENNDTPLYAQAKLADLGLAYNDATARLLEGSPAETGTPGFMSPEEAVGSKDITPATDVFSIGATMYGLLVGQPPFGGPSLSVVLSSTVIHDSNDLRTWRPDVSRATNRVVEACMKKNASARFQNGSILLNALKLARAAYNGTVEAQGEALKAIDALLPAVAQLDPAIKNFLANAEPMAAESTASAPAGAGAGMPALPDDATVIGGKLSFPVAGPSKPAAPAPEVVEVPDTAEVLIPDQSFEDPAALEEVGAEPAAKKSMMMPLMAAALLLLAVAGGAWQLGFLGKKKPTVVATAPVKTDKEKSDQEAKDKAEKEKAEADAKTKTDADKVAADAKLKEEADKLAAETKVKEEADAKAKLEAEAKAKDEQDAKLKAEAAAAEKAKQDEEDKKAAEAAKIKAEEDAKVAAAEKAKAEEIEKKKIAEAEARAKTEQEAAAKAAAEKEAAEAKKTDAEKKAAADAKVKADEAAKVAEAKAKADQEALEAKKLAEAAKPAPTPAPASQAVPAELAKEVTADLGNGVTMDFVLVPAGTFLMGTDRSVLAELCRKAQADEKDYADEVPAHRVDLGAYYIAKTPVTVAQFRAFVSATQYRTAAERRGEAYTLVDHVWQLTPGASWMKPGFPQEENHPVVNLNWRDCAAFAEWASKQCGKTLRLPTESEWEYAARGPKNLNYPWGNSWDGRRANHSDQHLHPLGPRGWTYSSAEDGFAFTAPVGSYDNRSWCGALDMAGNVFQWCQDAYSEYPQAQSPGAPEIITDATDVPANAKRALRGGSYLFRPIDCRSTARRSLSPNAWSYELGMRLAFTPAK